MSGPREDHLKTLCITLLGSGFAPLASGTAGSLVATVLYVLVLLPLTWATASAWLPAATVTLGVVLSAWLCVRWGEWAVARFGSNDPKPFVLDEFAGQWVALGTLPLEFASRPSTLAWIVVGQFLLFRVFDIVKPPPARRLERWPAGWGIVCDDLVSGLYAQLAGQCIWRLTPLAAWLSPAT